jgi:RNA polymerase-binding transcription factor DksA
LPRRGEVETREDRDAKMLNTAKIRKRLKARLETLGARIEGIKDELRAPPNPDFEEQATEAEGDEVLEGLEESVLTEITQIRMALQRMQEGTYGECVQCGEPIAEKRLEAIPHATLCINCASGAR